MIQPKGYVIYEGPSVLDGEPIIAILTVHSTNRKTGDMLQTWIMRRDMDPVEAGNLGFDVSVCGDCKARHYLGGHCYVNKGQAPRSIWKSWERGNYPFLTPRHRRKLKGRALRIGSYGDPAAVPFEVWSPLVDMSVTHTGYVHQMTHPNFDSRFLDICMASADTLDEADHYNVKGFRTFRVKHCDEPLRDNEIQCPYDNATDIQCIDCGICSGGYKHGGVSVAVNLHGSYAKRYDLIAKAI